MLVSRRDPTVREANFGGETMCLYRDEIYECETAGNHLKAMVVGQIDEGRRATLRPFDGSEERSAP
jgi:hypothetical protein